MAEPEKRVKFCRYCDGVIEWGTKVCPHCGESLEVTDFEEMEFIGPSGPPARVDGLRERPRAPRRGGAGPPVVKPLPEGPPVVEPLGRPPAGKPRGKRPPVVKPLGKPPGGTPRGKRPPVVEPLGRPPPVVKPLREAPPVVRPVEEEPPVVPPLGKEPPVVAPLDEGGLPAGVSPLASECPVCGAEMESAEDSGGPCASCGESVCIACLLRANGLRVSTSSERNRERWRAHVARSRPTQLRCAACGGNVS